VESKAKKVTLATKGLTASKVFKELLDRKETRVLKVNKESKAKRATKATPDLPAQQGQLERPEQLGLRGTKAILETKEYKVLLEQLDPLDQQVVLAQLDLLVLRGKLARLDLRVRLGLLEQQVLKALRETLD
jgi:hypothetical protein